MQKQAFHLSGARMRSTIVWRHNPHVHVLDDDVVRAKPEKARNTPMVAANLPRRFADFGHIPPTPANSGPTFAAPAACRGAGYVHIYAKAASPKADGLITSPRTAYGRLACSDL